MIRVVIAEDHHLVRQGICKLLEAEDAIQVVGEAGDGFAALALVRRTLPDVLVLDIAMPELNGLETMAQLKEQKPAPRVVILSMYADLSTVQQALQAGALAYVLKQAVADELLAAVRAAYGGSVYLSAGVSQVLTGGLLQCGGRTPLDRLSPREREVVRYIVEGLSTREIAEILCSSVKTVEKQRRDAMHKLEVDNLAALVRKGLELGLAGGEGAAAGRGTGPG